MNDLLFALLIMVLLYYFFIYLPQQKKSLSQPVKLTHSQTTQTEPIAPETKDLEKTIDHLLKDIQALNRQLK